MDDMTAPATGDSLTTVWSAVVERQPAALALHDPTGSYTFDEADRISTAVAVALVEVVGGVAGSNIGLLAAQSADAVIAYLALLKAGGVVVVLDPQLPADRLSAIAALAETRVCLADAEHEQAAHGLGEPVQEVVQLELLIAQARTSGRPTAAGLPDPASRSGTDAAAIVFTSGSTGRPKGVVQTHQQLLNDVLAHAGRCRLAPDDRIALVLPYGFAAGLLLLFAALLNGATVASFDPRTRGTHALLGWIRDEELTTLHCTPHLLRSLVGALTPGTVLGSVRLVCTVGEAVHGRDVSAIRQHLPPTASFVNWTGSSEVGTLTMFEVGPEDEVPDGNVPAGTPIRNKAVVLVDEDGSAVAQGETGELVVVSDFMSAGYWRDPENDELRFGTWADGRRSCRQGDLARFDADGNLLLLGRADAAVKVRGYLVEPGEIEAALLAERGVWDAVVVPVAEPPLPTRLVAYVVPEPGLRTQSPAALRRRLRERLPEYMVPSSIVNLASLPRNERGKVDRRALPVPVRQATGKPPRTQWEIVVADLWSEVLGLDSMGLDDDFMALGGDSLSAEEMLQSVQERLGVALVSSDLIEAPTLQAFTDRVTLGSATLPSHPDVVTLQASGGGASIFCFAGSGALALSFLPLSRHFGDCGFYAFQAHGLERRSLPDWSVEAGAQRFIEIIRVLQPHGPYRVCGHSFGGLMALEIAQRLTAGGETVELVMLIDTYLPQRAGQQPTFEYETLAARPSRGRRARLLAPARRVWDRALPAGLPVLQDWGRHARSYLAGVVPFSGQRQFDAFFDHGNLVTRRYTLRPYDGAAVLVFGEDNPDGADGWLPYLTGAVRFVDVPAEHSSLLREPHVSTIADVFRGELKP